MGLDSSFMRTNQPSGREPRRLGPGLGIRPPDAVIDVHSLERAVAAWDPEWREAPPLTCPLPNEAVDAFELAVELWG
jgi:hypothetical protein